MENILAQWNHWLGWTISSILITTGVVTVMHLLGKHCVHTPLWVVPIVFFTIFIIEVTVDVIKHYIYLQ